MTDWTRCQREGRISADSRTPLSPAWDKGISQDMGLSLQNQGKFWANQDEWSLVEAGFWFGQLVGGETWNAGADLAVWERDALRFRHDVK